MNRLLFFLCLVCTLGLNAASDNKPNLGVVIARATGNIMLIDANTRSSLGVIPGFGDLSHASVVFSNDERYAYIFGRDGGLSKVDLRQKVMAKRIMQAGNSIGGAISANGKLIAVANYEPGGVKIFNAESLELVTEIPAIYGTQSQLSKVVGLVEAPGQRFVFSLFDAGEIWIVDMSNQNHPAVQKFSNIGKQPYDALITPDGRYYIAGLFGEDGLALLDLNATEQGVRRVLDHYGRGEQALPVYKMPHLESCAVAGKYVFVPAVGHHEVIVVDNSTWREVKRIPMHGQPVFTMAAPDGRQVWVNFALPDNDTVQVIDTDSLEIVRELKPGKAVMHMEFTAAGNEVWVSVRDEDKVRVYDAHSYAVLAELPLDKPSGIFFSYRAHRTGF
ncbi:MAG: protein nirF [Gammaproteobacteria bacterium]|nr:protein nirF [Gammaproteobacteria bacterium]